jgi:DNA-directed RNA polymerase subunit RPC12/RpoP
MYECWACGKKFAAGWDARENHCRSTGHRRPEYECDTCTEFFFNEKARQKHMDVKGHHLDGNNGHDDSGYRSGESDGYDHEEWNCAICRASFYSEEECWEHEVEEHFYCSDCGRRFSSMNGLENVSKLVSTFSPPRHA